MRTTEELRAEAREAHGIFMAVRSERSFWQLVVILTAISGIIVGAGAVRCGMHSSPDTALIPAAIRVPLLEAEVERLRVECAPPVLEARCPSDPLGKACAVSWKRILQEPSFDVVFVNCDGGKWWRVDWTQVLQ